MPVDEDFSLVMVKSEPSQDTLEGIQALIANYKKKYDDLVQEQQELTNTRNDLQEATQKFRQFSDRQAQGLEKDQLYYSEQIENEKAKLNALRKGELELMEEIQRVEAALKEEDASSSHLKQMVDDVFPAVPERRVVFTGQTGNAGEAQMLEMKSRIVYPMLGGTALVTFEEEAVAQEILAMKTHRVELAEECRITVEARPVQLMLPRLVEIDSEVCPRSILISNLPKMEKETLLDKLEIHFSRRKHGGGEVENCEMLDDSGTVVLTFVEDNIARGLTDKEYHEVKLQQKKHRVRVTPFLNGTITDLKTKMTTCQQTLLLTGIPPVMEQETLQDMLEIHFQKRSNGGGEIEAICYNPVGGHASALFEDVSSERS